MEEWRDIEGYEGLYKVSNYGRVKSLGNGNSNNSKERIMKPSKNSDGYLNIGLCKDGKRKNYKVHRLVAQAFIPNPNNYPEVNHKDENKENNCDNLEWCDRKYNMNYGTVQQRRADKRSKQVCQYSLQGELIKVWNSTMECGRNGFNSCHISSCCNGRQGFKSHKGFIWKFQ